MEIEEKIMNLKRTLILIFFIGVVLSAHTQVLNRSTIAQGTNGLVPSEWDLILMPSLSGEIERDFVYVPFSVSNAFTSNRYTVGTSFIVNPIPFRLSLLSEVNFSYQKWMPESQTGSYGATWWDSDGVGGPDKYRYTLSDTYTYAANGFSQSGLYLSPGVVLPLGPLTGGARYIFKLAHNNKIDFEATQLSTVKYDEFAAENVATTNDSHLKITIADSGLINGLVIGQTLNTGTTGIDFLTFRYDLFSTVQNYGTYDMQATENAHLLDQDPIAATGTTAPDGATKDYLTDKATQTVTGGYLSFAGLIGTSTVFGGVAGPSSIFAAPTNGRYQYVPVDPSGTAALPATINMPQVVLEVGATPDLGLYGFNFPLAVNYQTSFLNSSTFTLVSNNYTYANETTESSHTKTTETLTIPVSNSNDLMLGLGVNKEFRFDDAAAFLFGADYSFQRRTYQMKIQQDVETVTQTDGDADGAYTTAGVDVNTVQTQKAWYKMRDFSSSTHTVQFPISFIYSITPLFSFFGGALFSYAVGDQTTSYINTGGYKEDYTVDQNNADPNTNTTTTVSNYGQEPATVPMTSGITPVITQTWNFGLRYSFTDHLVFTTQLCTGSGMPTITGLFNTSLVAELCLKK